MDRMLVYPDQMLADTDLLNSERNTLIALSWLTQSVLGTGPFVDGFPCVPGTGLTVNVESGAIYLLDELDASAYGSLGANSLLIVKQGLYLSTDSLSCPAPGASGQSINYLVEVAFEDVDINPVLEPFYNAANPALPLNGPGGGGASSNTVRSAAAVIAIKAGVAAATGSQTTPTADSGYIPLWSVQVDHGDTSVPGGNISVAAGAPFINPKLPAVGAEIAAAIGTAEGYTNTQITGALTTAQGYATIAQNNAENAAAAAFPAPNNKLANMPAGTVKANLGGSTAAPSDVSLAALLAAFNFGTPSLPGQINLGSWIIKFGYHSGSTSGGGDTQAISWGPFPNAALAPFGILDAGSGTVAGATTMAVDGTTLTTAGATFVFDNYDAGSYVGFWWFVVGW